MGVNVWPARGVTVRSASPDWFSLTSATEGVPTWLSSSKNAPFVAMPGAPERSFIVTSRKEQTTYLQSFKIFKVLNSYRPMDSRDDYIYDI